jgi:hypothetical protein
MPRLTLFTRKWVYSTICYKFEYLCLLFKDIASDDLLLPFSASYVYHQVLAVISLVLALKNESLHIYLFPLLGNLIIIALVEIAVAYISSRGTISDDKPRQSIHWWLYTYFLVMLIQIGIEINGLTLMNEMGAAVRVKIDILTLEAT